MAILIAIAMAALGWVDARRRIDATQTELAHRLRDIEAEARAARALAQQAQESVRETQTRVGQLDSRLGELQSQKRALESLYQDLARNRDAVQLAEIEQVLSIASQQLQLSGNVHAALLALQFADDRLARADRPQLLPIRRAIAHDIERLTAAPALDLPGLSLRIDALVEAVDGLPLAFDERTAPAPAGALSSQAGSEGFFARLGAQVWSELRKLVVLRKVESPAPPLLPPSQSYFLRENLRLRLLNARLSLLMRDETGYRGDLRAAQTWVKRYFDLHAKRTEDALAQLEQLSSVSLDLALPDISESLEAVRSFKAHRAGDS
ncbi:MAG: uroporphyrinogen-III C-methyltransferase [Burkholderiales bacterium]